MTYKHFTQVRWVVAAVALIAAVVTIAYFAGEPRKITYWTALVTVLWALGPPIWFFGEYYAVDHEWLTDPPDPKNVLLESVKSYADYASKIWAAVLAAVLFLVK